MIYISNTPDSAGVTIVGDCLDLEALYEALHAIIGDEDEYVRYGLHQSAKCLL